MAQVCSGQAVALMFKFLNNITYTVVNTISVAFTGLLAALFLGDGVTYDFSVACMLVSLSGFIMYKRQLDKHQVGPFFAIFLSPIFVQSYFGSFSYFCPSYQSVLAVSPIFANCFCYFSYFFAFFAFLLHIYPSFTL